MKIAQHIKQNKRSLLIFVIGILVGAFMPKTRLILNAGFYYY